MTSSRLLRYGFAVAAFAALISVSAQAQSVEEFYKGKRLTMIVAGGVGGGYDAYGRMLARHIGKHIPGNPTLIVQNIDGASGMEGTNYVANKAARDGSVIMATYNSLLIQPLFDNNNVQYDPLTLSWIGSVGKLTNFCVTYITSPVTTLDQAKEREVLVASTGATGNYSTFPIILNRLAGTKFRPISGYTTAETYLAVERGEADGICGLAYSTALAAKPDWFLDKKLHILAQFGLTPSPDMPGVPLAIDYVKDTNDKKIIELLAYPTEMGRPMGAPPGVPKDRLEALRKAFDETMKDPEFLEESKKAHLDVDPVGGAAMEAMLKEAFATPKSVIQRYNEITSVGATETKKK